MKNIIAILIALTWTTAFTQEIPKQEADSMMRALRGKAQDTDRIYLLLNLAQFYIFKPGENQTDFDSARVYIDEAKQFIKPGSSADVRGYLLLTESYWLQEQAPRGEKGVSFKSEKGEKMAGEAVSVLEAGTNKLYLGLAYFELSQYYNYYELPAIAKKIDFVEHALAAFRQAGDRQRIASTLTMLGDLYCKKQDYPAAIKLLNEALSVYDTLKYNQLQQVYVLLGQSYRGLGDEVQGLSNFLKALKSAHLVNDSSQQICQITNSLGAQYSRIGNKETAVKYWSEGLEVAKKNKDEFSTLVLATNLASCYNDLNQPEHALRVMDPLPRSFLNSGDTWNKCRYVSAYFGAYLALKQYTTATSFRDSLRVLLDDSLLDNQSRSSICRLLTTYYLDTKQYAKAKHYIKENLEIANSINYEPGATQGFRLWYKVDSAEGNYKDAFNHLNYFKTKMDSAVSANMLKQLQILNVEYETEAKEDSINLKNKDILLLTQQNSLQQANLKQAGLEKNVTISGIILALAVIGLLYRQYRHKQKSSNLISQKNELLQHLLTEKEWLVKEIHHRVKNNFQTVMGLLGTQSAYLKNEESINAMNESRQRIQAMSLIHQRLYQSNNLSAIKMTDYIHELVDSLSDSFDMGKRVRFNLAVEPVQLDLAHCIPLGLIINEAITNSFKYAFAKYQQGDISISLSKIIENEFLLSVKDNGIGLPPGFNVHQYHSMGMNLMRGLSEELGAQFAISNQNGTCINVNFTYAHDTAKEPASLQTIAIQ